MDTHVSRPDSDIVLTRRFDAAPPLLYKAWTDADMLAAWFGPFPSTATLDAREGGAFTVTMHGPDGTDYPIDGEFGAMNPPDSLVMVMRADRHPQSWRDFMRQKFVENGGKLEDYADGPITTRVDFKADGDGTVMTVRQTFPSVFLRDAHANEGNPDGWNASFDKLAALLAKPATLH